ncbi:helix-turn-helix domain-containing protein [Pseudomonas sp. NPDC090202]|uniref:AraC family transcriptional regulator n=1 Tax=unclassified Pseudomonas TaxID=196821 RepID=UPI0037FEC924
MISAALRHPIVIRSDDMNADEFGALFSRVFGDLYANFPAQETPIRVCGVYGRYDGVSFRHMRYGGDVAFATPDMADEISFILPTTGQMIANLLTQSVATPAVGLAVEKSHMRSVRMLDGHTQYGFSIRRGLFVQRLSVLLGRPVMKAIHFQSRVDLSDKAFDGLKALVGFATSVEADSLINARSLMPERLQEMLIDAVLEVWPHSYSEDLQRPQPGIAPRHVKLAMDYLQEHPQTLVSGTELAALSNVSLRALQEGFKRFVGTSIVAYQRQVRLEYAWKLLQCEPSSSVNEVALRLGFSNAGRFSQYFQQAYGLRPQDVRKGLHRH